MKRVLAVLLAAAASVVTLGGAPAGGAESPALSAVADCVRQRGHLLVLALVDESGSLQGTDPSGVRVVALQAAVASLRNLARRGHPERPLDIELKVAGFSADFTSASAWTRLDDVTYPGLTQTVAGFSSRDDGIDTDFATATEGARDAFAQRTADIVERGAEPPCQFMLLFTDGDYDIEPRTTEARRRLGMTKPYAPGVQIVDEPTAGAVVERGKKAVCDTGAIADELRDNGVVTATVALTKEISARDQQFLRAMATGSAGQTECGSKGSAKTGLYLAADRIADLLFVLNRLIVGPGGATELGDKPVRQRVCGSRPDPRCTREFEIDASLRGFHVLADLGAPGLQVDLRSPGSSKPLSFTFGPGAIQRLGTAEVSSGWLSESALALDVTLEPGQRDWIGTWSVTFVDPSGNRAGAAARSQIFVYGDLTPVLLGDPVLTIGETTPIRVRIIDQKGTPRTPKGLVRSAVVSGILADPAGKTPREVTFTGPDDAGEFSGELIADETVESSVLNLALRLDIETTSGLALTPTSRNYPLTVRPPASFAGLEPAAISFGRLSPKEPATRALTVRGGARGSSCVWLEGSDFDVRPRGIDEVTVTAEPAATTPASCVRVAAGETKQLTVTLAARGRGSGALSGHLALRVSSEESDRVLTRRVPASAVTYIPVDIGERNRWAVLLLLAGLVMPIAFLYLANRWLGRFAPSEGLRHVAIPVTTDGTIVRRADSGAPLDVTALEFHSFDGTDIRVRRLTAHGLEFRVRQPRTPVVAPWGTVQVPGGYVTAGLGHDRRPDGATGRLPVNLAGEWVFHLTAYAAAVREEETTATGTLHLLVPDSPDGIDPGPIVEKVQRQLPSRALALVKLKAERDAAEAADVGRPAATPDQDLPPAPDWDTPGGPTVPPPSYGDRDRSSRSWATTSSGKSGTEPDPPERPLPKPPEY